MKLESNMAQSRRQDDRDFNLREWSLKAKISRENTNSRRFSASYIRSFREDANYLRSNISISSTASSPGYYTLRDEIDPSTYSFTTALKALQAKTVYSWEYMSPDGLALNSKWNEAEKYICNPLSGEVPLECLSAKTLSGRSFRQLKSKITMSAPLIYPSQYQSAPQLHPKPPIKVVPHLPPHQLQIQIPSKEKIGSITRDVGTQSSTTPGNYLSSRSPSPARTPSIDEKTTKRCVADDSPVTTPQVKTEQQVEVKETREKEDTKRNEEEQVEEDQTNNCKVKQKSSRLGGCLSWRSLCMRQKQKQQKEKKHSKSIRKKKNNNNIFLCHV